MMTPSFKGRGYWLKGCGLGVVAPVAVIQIHVKETREGERGAGLNQHLSLFPLIYTIAGRGAEAVDILG